MWRGDIRLTTCIEGRLTAALSAPLWFGVAAPPRDPNLGEAEARFGLEGEGGDTDCRLTGSCRTLTPRSPRTTLAPMHGKVRQLPNFLPDTLGAPGAAPDIPPLRSLPEAQALLVLSGEFGVGSDFASPSGADPTKNGFAVDAVVKGESTGAEKKSADSLS